MYFLTMRKLHDREPIQSNQGKAGSFSGRAGHDFGAFWKAGRQQYRNWISEPKSSCDGFNGGLSRVTREAFQGTKRFIANAFESTKWFHIEGQEMRMKRDYFPSQLIEENLPVHLHPVPELPADFLKRKEQVQQMIAKMILLGKKKGRPSQGEELYEEAA